MARQSRPYEVQFTDAALRHLRNYPRNDQRRILARIEQLAEDPRAMPDVKRLVELDVAYRLRVGRYRVLFDRDDMIRIIDVIDVLPEVGPIGEIEMLEQVQILRENGDARFAVIPFDEYVTLKELLSDEEKLADYLDYLHMQNVKAQGPARHSLAEAKAALELD